MRLPKKISPDSLRDAVVEVRYLSNTPFELLVGIFSEAFDTSYTYTNRPVKPSAPGTLISAGGLSLLYNERISIQLLPNSFIFSCLNAYIGWEAYYSEIEKALKIISEKGRVQQWIRIGIRYITEYTKKDLKDCTKFSFGFGMPDIESSSTTFHSEFIYQDSKVNLNLVNKMPVIKQVEGKTQLQFVATSIIDVDVIKDLVDVKELKVVFELLKTMHLTEKEVFFSLLKEDFLKTLNPEY